ncbi:hypothetical protein RhiirA5_505431 [Rhizophagus irregularis]|nr:hypothetical protein RhiirA5_505431 [Rhizophagus irregularis]PKC58165.1 hypothetical protein RhiirA1_541228 [Rhizophagus irregularis]PKY33062.1 hypothetical protein RhiirB3_532309 [Rhizophagus irregularis]GBC18583.2 hypothetical protein GLOIN_2v1584057 [Rhizophagus irregularis DAOM 181602=DAOM 197198]CAG8721943.1 2495_t:CDS:2 [Rhizophagus irregularis]
MSARSCFDIRCRRTKSKIEQEKIEQTSGSGERRFKNPIKFEELIKKTSKILDDLEEILTCDAKLDDVIILLYDRVLDDLEEI